jgi:CPA2 family monovalent cation:H+ antiporter-2
MGFILAESTSAEKIEKLIKPVKDLFAAVFFVSIGMMINPALILEHIWAVVAVTTLTILGKFVSTTGGAIVSGQPLKQSVQVGMSMAQIGEFAFIVATLGLSLGVISDFLFPVAVGASAITTFTTPYMIKYSDKTFIFIEKLFPKNWLSIINRYSATTQKIQIEKNWKKNLKTFATIIFINGAISVALIMASLEFLIPFLQDYLSEPIIYKIASLIITLAIIFPFLWGIMAKKPKKLAYKELWITNDYSRGPLIMMEILRIIIGLVIISFLVVKIFSTAIAVIVLVPLILIILLIFSKQVKKFYHRIENRFVSNLNTDDKDLNRGSRKIRQQITDSLNISPWDAHIIELKVRPYAKFIGIKLEKLSWREKYGINIAYIRRGDEIIYTPSGTSLLFPQDKVGIIATEEQMQIFKPVFDANTNTKSDENSIDDFVISSIRVSEKNKLRGLSIRESRLREKTNGLILGIERNENRIFNPVSSTIFEKNDIVWIAGERGKIRDYS